MGKDISPLKQTLTPCHASHLPFPNLKKEIAKGGGSKELGDPWYLASDAAGEKSKNQENKGGRRSVFQCVRVGDGCPKQQEKIS